ncbi:MAG: sugar ABC transporter ATP-binding protein [Ruminococcaceae bacterium]|nr:sugar ABC transporter ATP-binding protein [Oscillospiraceae bacterium]
MSSSSKYILEMIDIDKSFPGVKALEQVHFHLVEGEVHALIGENGAGKSTLMKVLQGIHQADSGEIIYKGESVNFKNTHDALSAGISMIHQELSLVPTTSIGENIWIGRGKRFTKNGILSLRRMKAEAQKLLDRLGIKLDANRIVSTLSVAEMQMVEIARAVSYDSSIIIMDEPTSSLSDSETELLYEIIRKLSSEGTSIIYISHKLEEIFEICDNVTVMRDAKFVAKHAVKDVTTQMLITEIAGREIKDLYPKTQSQIGDVVLEVRNLSSEKKFQDVSFKVRKGEILGFCGLIGAGRTEIMRAVFGLDKYDSGEVLVDGEVAKINHSWNAIDYGIAMVTEDRRKSGIMFTLPVLYNISLAKLKELCNKLSFINKAKEEEDVAQIVKKLDVQTPTLRTPIGSLSGGNQQKSILARWLLADPRILILDEPTRGIDVGSKTEIYRLMSELASSGMAIIMVSSELPEILGMCDRILVARNGRIVGEFDRNEADQETLLNKAFGG